MEGGIEMEQVDGFVFHYGGAVGLRFVGFLHIQRIGPQSIKIVACKASGEERTLRPIFDTRPAWHFD
jgi:hypothetical protein